MTWRTRPYVRPDLTGPPTDSIQQCAACDGVVVKWWHGMTDQYIVWLVDKDHAYCTECTTRAEGRWLDRNR